MGLLLVWMAVNSSGSVALWGFPVSGPPPTKSLSKDRKTTYDSPFVHSLSRAPSGDDLLREVSEREDGGNCSERVVWKKAVGEPGPFESWPSWLPLQLFRLRKTVRPPLKLGSVNVGGQYR